ncbi:glycosyltransferase family 4 protein [Candidatus Laterigemmans baculatus]|uniref:glycosyltransferase family 4 protein n=1 Tax=Candidatus Laterigemmans baculatus TaxID=2770505 RepID=UPI0013DD0CD8|nr:glycosyltransferase family 1 protein [Candidatus Laterigemmans baculatus]
MSRDLVDESEFQTFLQSLTPGNWEVHIDKTSRRMRQAMSMCRLPNYNAIKVHADVYLNTDVDYLGSSASPQINTVADLSSVGRAAGSSLKWHGRWMRRHAFDVLARHAQNVVAISVDTKRSLAAYAPALEAKTTVVYCGIDEAWHAAGDGDMEPVPQKLLQPRPYWIWWGLATRRKNLHRAVQAYAALLNSGSASSIPDFLIVGKFGGDSEDLPHLIGDLKLRDRVRHIPFQPLNILVSLVSESSGLIFPSLVEGFGLPAVEAMRLGKPVLISGKGALPEVTGGLGLECEPEEIASITRSMNDLCDEPKWVDRAAQRKQWARQFTYSRAAAEYGRIIDSIVN